MTLYRPSEVFTTLTTCPCSEALTLPSKNDKIRVPRTGSERKKILVSRRDSWPSSNGHKNSWPLQRVISPMHRRTAKSKNVFFIFCSSPIALAPSFLFPTWPAFRVLTIRRSDHEHKNLQRVPNTQSKFISASINQTFALTGKHISPSIILYFKTNVLIEIKAKISPQFPIAIVVIGFPSDLTFELPYFRF